MGFEKFCAEVFERMERNLIERNELLFWSAGKALPTLRVVEKAPGNGTWFARADIASGQVAGISVMLVHGELRVGAIIPKQLINRDSDDDMIVLSPDGNPHDAMRELEGAYLFDRHYDEDPFTARWIIDSYSNPDMREAVALTMGALVSSTWKAAYNVISHHAQGGLDHTLMLIASKELPTDRLKRETDVAIIEQFKAPGLGFVIKTRSAHSADELSAILVDLGLGDITVCNHEEIESEPGKQGMAMA
jgi:hypothetical protein